jgi:hypothetical protein
MLNFPKTGSSFVRAALKKVHRYDTLSNRIRRQLGLANVPPMVELILPVIDREFPQGLRGQHGTYRQIPEEHRHKTIASVIRNPFGRYVSVYLFGWWKKTLQTDERRLKKAFSRFPELSFQEYYEMMNLLGRENKLRDIIPKIELGVQTIQFIQFYFKEPETVLREIDHDYIEQKQYLHDMAQVVFLHQEKLNKDLYEFLLGFGYPKEDIDFIQKEDKVNVTPRAVDQLKASEFYTQELVKDILEKDRLLFELFPEYRMAFNETQGNRVAV